jgi:RNA polymerase sigma factor (sigma-70 family)
MTLAPDIRDAMLAAIPKLRAFAISLCRNGDQAEDLVQETLLSACTSIHSFKPGTHMSAWLSTILRNHFYSEWRKRRRLESIDDHAETMAAKPTQIAHWNTTNSATPWTSYRPSNARRSSSSGPRGNHTRMQRKSADARPAR